MKPPIPNIIAHYSESESNFIMPLIVAVAIIGLSLYLYFTSKDDSKAS
jgi:hypothetical protein